MNIPNLVCLHQDFEVKRRITILLFSNGYEVTVVSTIKEALAILRVGSFEGLLCGQHFPDGDAEHLVQTIKSSPILQKIPIMVLSANLSEEKAQRLHALDVAQCLDAGGDSLQILKKVKGVINLHLPKMRKTSQGISGQLATMRIVDLINRLAEKHGTGRISIDGPKRMEIFIKDSKITHAKHGITVGKKALFRCLLIAEAAYHFDPGEETDQITISEDLHQVLEEARITNEKLMANSHRLPHVNHRVRIMNPKTLQLSNLKAESRAALEIIRKYPRIGTYLNRLNLADVVCYEYLLTFLEHGLIELLTERKPVKIVCDMSCDLPPEQLEELDVSVLPIKLQVGKDIYGPHEDHQALYDVKTKVLEQSKVLLPDETALSEHYLRLVTEFDCLSILQSSTLSPLFDRVQDTIQKVNERGINGKMLLANELVALNTHSLSLGIGLLVQSAATMAKDGKSIEEIEERLIEHIARLQVFFILMPDRSTLYKKGKGPAIYQWDGTQLQQTQSLAKGASAVDALVEEVAHRVHSKSRLHLSVGHVHAEKETIRLISGLRNKLGYVEPQLFDIGPITGYLVGKGAVGLAFFQD